MRAEDSVLERWRGNHHRQDVVEHFCRDFFPPQKEAGKNGVCEIGGALASVLQDGYFKDPSGKADKTGSDGAGAGENFGVNKDNMDQLKKQLEKAMKQIPDFDKL